MKVVVVGGGLAGCAAALDLVDASHSVTLLEARPTLGGAVQTLPEREGDPAPPPDNGQHIALGCFTEYMRFLQRIGEGDSFRRERLALTVIAEGGSRSEIRPSLAAMLSYAHLSLRDRVRIPLVTARCRTAQALPGESFGTLLRRLGASDRAVARFWDVFVRPALNLRADESDAGAGLFTVRTAFLGRRRESSDLILPMRPLGAMHGEAARRTLEGAGASVVTGVRVEDLDELDADAIVVALPPRESALLLHEPVPALEDSPIVSVHLLFDRPILRDRLAALLGSDAHWVFDRGALTALGPSTQLPVRDHREVPPWPTTAQYLTVVSSGAPELMELRGRELVERIAGQLTDRLAAAELLWSRVSREPRATIALRPETATERLGPRTTRANVVRAGAWTDTGWPATMESAVRSGRRAARLLAPDVTSHVSCVRGHAEGEPKARGVPA
jgi:squalene-associated FAD-dependent desaturase